VKIFFSHKIATLITQNFNRSVHRSEHRLDGDIIAIAYLSQKFR